ncbi:large ribosomal subunit protein bL35m isoform X3 [Chiloscyllium punctatum]|uniref:large ribosomal subunit protein bL35m isoform X3 n=2 Tax=Chiloscyllium punctatum TaxID=137246 RepID=UPI003B63ACA9
MLPELLCSSSTTNPEAAQPSRVCGYILNDASLGFDRGRTPSVKMAALRSAAGTLMRFLPLVRKNVAGGSSITQLVSRFATLDLRYIQSPTISTVTKLGLPLGSNYMCAHKFAAIKSLPNCATNFQQSVRALTYCSLRKGKRKSVKSVVKRFLRLHCGLWVRRKAGYKKKLWKKRPARKRRLRQHVFCNKTQSKMLDKMTTDFWKRRNCLVR